MTIRTRVRKIALDLLLSACSRSVKGRADGTLAKDLELARLVSHASLKN
jgi:hypothetical protein